MTESIDIWAIKSPQGVILLNTMAHSEYNCIYAYCIGRPSEWEELKSHGFNCVRVQVREIKNE